MALAGDLNWSVEKRLEFIELRLFWNGSINRSDVMDEFEVSVPQASKDLALYQEIASGNLVYNKSEKRYLAAPKFKPALTKPTAEAYLSLLAQDGAATLAFGSDLPPADTLPALHRRIDVEVLREVLAGLRQERPVQILYQSMNPGRPDPELRTIFAHAVASDGLRWHVRAYCYETGKFKDFLLSRMEEARLSSDRLPRPEISDRLWNEEFSVRMAANPKLSASQQKAVRLEYGFRGESLSLSLRKAMLYYFAKRYRLDLPEDKLDPRETPLVIRNRAEFDAALAEAMA